MQVSDEGQDQTPLDNDKAELARLQQRVARLEAENARLKQYFSLPTQDSTASSPTTASQRLEGIQREHYRFYQALTNSNAGIGIFTGPDYVTDFANPTYERLTGRVINRILGKPLREVFPELEGQGLFEIMDEVMASGKPFTAREMPVQLVRQEDGTEETIFFTFTYHPLFSIEGEVEGFFTHALDVSEEVKIKRALQHERQLLQQLFQEAPAIVSITRGPKHVIELANARYLQLIDRPASSILGRPAQDVFPEVIAQGFIDLQDQVYQTGQPFVGQETKLQLNLDGSDQLTDLFMNFVFQPFFASDGSSVEGIFAFWIDVTEQVKARQEIERLSRLKDEFLAIASHDLRTPLTSVKGYIQLLQRSLFRHQQVQLFRPGLNNLTQESEAQFLDNSLQIVSTILNQINRLNELITRLLDFSQLEEGQLKLQYIERVDLIKLVQEVVSAVSLSSEQHQILMRPSTEPNILITCDPTRLEQVLNNLIGNALKYRPANTTVTVGLEAARFVQEQNREEVVMWVRDEGFGIAQEQQARLFERFYQVRNEQNANKGGLGLGLYISAEVVKQHGGRLWVESELGKGSTFYVALPVAPPKS